MIRPDWPAPPRVRALVTTRGDADPALPAPPAWLRQVHGTRVVDAAEARDRPEADAAVARGAGAVCAVQAADCLPVLLADTAGTVVGAAHAGWRGLAAGVIEATVAHMRVAPATLMAWLGPAIGPQRYEVGAEVRDAFLARDAAAARAFTANRPGHWLLDLYAVARQRLATCGVTQVHGGDFCTYSDAARFPSWRRERTPERIAAYVWLESRSP
ncbi:MAG: peptidoglycan editing factor PgeF [Betaproteobacteria bacterium]|nr:peptidoglycan editing factor PgeF [Betaproteobacteria bacterium]MDH5579011.1 peptidoglycan editing factor PgeF [Betaproteobacteria bacterium]